VEAKLPYVFNQALTIVDVVTTIADADIVIRLELLARICARDFRGRIMLALKREQARGKKTPRVLA
jgi:hypothetical protein